MKIRNIIRIALALLLAGLLLLPVIGHLARAQEESPAGGRIALVMQAGKAMESRDPQGLRFQAAELFVSLLDGETPVSALSYAGEILETADSPQGVSDCLRAGGDEEGADPGAALLAAVEQGPQAVIFLCDEGVDLPSDGEMRASLEKEAQAIVLAQREGIPVHCIVLGRDGEEAQRAAEATGGEFLQLESPEELYAAYVRLFARETGGQLVPLEHLESSPQTVSRSFEVPRWGMDQVWLFAFGATAGQLRYSDGAAVPAVESSRPGCLVFAQQGPQPGFQNLSVTAAAPGEDLTLWLVSRSDAGVSLDAAPTGLDSLRPGVSTTVTAALTGTGAEEPDAALGYSAQLLVMDRYGAVTRSLPMIRAADQSPVFGVEVAFNEDVYCLQAVVSGSALEFRSGLWGPRAISLGEEENQAPQAVEPELSRTLWQIAPLTQGELRLSLDGLARDAEDDSLTWRVASPGIFREGIDYSLEDGALRLWSSPLPGKGLLVLEGQDSGGLSCRVSLEIGIRRVNGGLLLLAGAGLLALALAGVLALRWRKKRRRKGTE